MKRAIEKRHAEQRPRGIAVGLGGAHEAGELAIELRLHRQYPADDAVVGIGCRRAGCIERIVLRQRNIEREHGQCADEDDLQNRRGFQRAAQHHSHFTSTLLANFAPEPALASDA